MKAVVVQTNFTSGELSPQLRGRVDIAKYFNGAASLENFMVKPQGGAIRRTGTYFVNEVKDSAKATRLVVFSYSSEQNYVLEFGDEYIRFYKDGGRIEVASVPVEVVTPYQDTDLDGLYFTQSADVLFICHPNYPPKTLSRNSHTSWTLSDFETDDGPYLAPNTDENKIVWIDSAVDQATLTAPSAGTFVAGDVFKYVEYNRNGNTLIAQIAAVSVDGKSCTVVPEEAIVKNVDPRVTFTYAAPKLTATFQIFSRYNVNSVISWASNTWAVITTFTNTSTVNVSTPLTMRAVVSGLVMSNRTITANVKSNVDVWEAADVGRKMRFNFSGDQIWGKITGFTSARHVTMLLDTPVPRKESDQTYFKDDGRTSSWRLGAWSTSQGYPSCVTFHEERLVFAATPKQMQTIWMSKSSEYSNFSPTEPKSEVLDNNAITYTLASSQVNSIVWLQTGVVLLIGTSGAEWQAKSQGLVEPMTPTNLVLSQQTAMGSLTNSRPVRVGSSTIFTHKSGRQIREMYYKFDIDAFVANDLAILSDHIFRRGVASVRTSYQQTPVSTVWVVLSNGELAGLTFVKEQEVYAWHRHILGGTDAAVKDIAVLPSTVTNEDEIWLIVSRTINGVTKKYIEYLTPEFIPLTASDKDDAFYVDCGLSYEGSSTNTVSGLSHLEGETVHAVVNGTAQPAVVVSGGSVTLQDSGTVIHVGLPYTSLIELLPPEGGGDFGSAQGQTKRVHNLVVRVHDSLGLSIGSTRDNLEQQSFRTSDGLMSVSPDLVTGDYAYNIEQTYGTNNTFFIAQTQPYPLTVLAAIFNFRAYSGAQ
jgi:hypothetical protein